jgi:hypothetical protein
MAISAAMPMGEIMPMSLFYSERPDETRAASAKMTRGTRVLQSDSRRQSRRTLWRIVQGSRRRDETVLLTIMQRPGRGSRYLSTCHFLLDHASPRNPLWKFRTNSSCQSNTRSWTHHLHITAKSDKIHPTITSYNGNHPDVRAITSLHQPPQSLILLPISNTIPPHHITSPQPMQKSLKMAVNSSQTFSLTTRKSLPNTKPSLSIPHIHLGVYLTSGRETSTAVRHALETGYRAFDSAQMYHNEREVGSTILKFLEAHPELKREDIHYTSKLASNGTSYDAVRKSISRSVKECGLGYIDLFLLHSPYGGKEARLTSWKALEDAVLEGEVRIPGVSNFGEKHVSQDIRSASHEAEA